MITGKAVFLKNCFTSTLQTHTYTIRRNSRKVYLRINGALTPHRRHNVRRKVSRGIHVIGAAITRASVSVLRVLGLGHTYTCTFSRNGENLLYQDHVRKKEKEREYFAQYHDILANSPRAENVVIKNRSLYEQLTARSRFMPRLPKISCRYTFYLSRKFSELYVNTSLLSIHNGAVIANMSPIELKVR